MMTAGELSARSLLKTNNKERIHHPIIQSLYLNQQVIFVVTKVKQVSYFFSSNNDLLHFLFNERCVKQVINAKDLRTHAIGK